MVAGGEATLRLKMFSPGVGMSPRRAGPNSRGDCGLDRAKICSSKIKALVLPGVCGTPKKGPEDQIIRRSTVRGKPHGEHWSHQMGSQH